ncbi:MAG: hypothetical protein ACRYFS_14405 [Janthinobacterium lividum]
MEAAKSVAIGYNRLMVRKRTFYFLLLFLAFSIGSIFPYFVLLDLFRHSWIPIGYALIFTIFLGGTTSTLPPGCGAVILCYWRNLPHEQPAFLIEKNGILANAAGNPYGLLKWDEITQIRPWTAEYRFFPNRLFKTPLIYKEPGVAIVFKENIEIKRNPAWRRLYTKREAKSGRGTWHFVPEALLAVTTTELIQQINQFYATQVRGH